MNPILWILIEAVFSLLAGACVLRAYGWWTHLNPNNPLAQFVHALTNWLVRPLGKVIKPSRKFDWPSIVAALLLALLASSAYFLLTGKGVDPVSMTLTALIYLLRWTLYLFLGLIIMMALISIINPYAPLAPALNQLTQPLLGPLRRVIPTVGSFDLSPLVAILLIQVLLMVLDPVRILQMVYGR